MNTIAFISSGELQTKKIVNVLFLSFRYHRSFLTAARTSRDYDPNLFNDSIQTIGRGYWPITSDLLKVQRAPRHSYMEPALEANDNYFER